uniref:adenylate cyclase n=1 Tax=Caenorhabditis tropicalis TaxID=1561998 RepID=A0A1I7T2H9_9PELO
MDDEVGERTPALGGSCGPSVRAHSSSPRRVPLFERASARWWNPQFRSATLEAQYWKCSFSQLRDRFRSGLIYIAIVIAAWTLYLALFDKTIIQHWVVSSFLVAIIVAMFAFTACAAQYQRFYMPTSFLCTFLICLVTLLIFSAENQAAFMTPVASLATSFQVVLLIYTVIPLPLYLCILIGFIYSILFEILNKNKIGLEEAGYIKLVLHAGVHLLGVHLFILTQVRQRKTFLKVGQSMLARKDLELETQFKDHMIQSVMPKKVADELLKDASELRRPSASNDSNCRTSNATQVDQPIAKMVPEYRKFRPFTMNLMTNVSILFADIAGFTKMSSNKSADELVNLLNDLFGRFDTLCRQRGLEKISTLGDCYYCVAGCPEPCDDHACRTVEMGLDMIVAIRQFDIDRGQEVNMRVGIHTGKVMCGMVGTKRFKFDVFSNDVTLANEMESSGVAGRVHVSEATAKLLKGLYEIEEGPDYDGPLRMQVQGTERRVKPESMKTYFIKGRINEGVEEEVMQVQEVESLHSQKSSKKSTLKQKWAEKLKMNHTNSYPMRAAAREGGGSLRIKLAERNRSTQLLPKESNSICVMEDNRKSASLQALATNNFNGSNTDTNNTYSERGVATGSKKSVAGSESNSIKGSRSSGLQLSLQDGNSDLNSVGGLDTAISHHHNAASLTRFDTDNNFDQRLAMVIGQGEGGFDKGFWNHHDSLNRWTLRFNEKDVEQEYRAHFVDSAERYTSAKKGHVERHQDLMEQGGDKDGIAGSAVNKYRYSGVFIDIIVATLIFVIAGVVALMSVRPFPLSLLAYFPFAAAILVLTIILIGLPLLSRKKSIQCANQWMPRHLIGLLLIFLPIGVAICIMPICQFGDCANVILNYRLAFSYVTILAIFAHCNFSQLAAWPKTTAAVLIGLLHIGGVFYCEFNLKHLHEEQDTCNVSTIMIPPIRKGLNYTIALNSTSARTLSQDFGSPLFIWELFLDVVLSIVLVAFLNYQFETAFRMSFFGDVQARRDTERMQIVRDQADWLLNNVIPAHAVESLKTDTKYSENHETVGVLFASITNWNDMYEENFEGGREFLRVLNEVIGDFDELLDRPDFTHIEKIKTIGPAYMAASGLNPERKKNMLHPKEHLYQMVEFALAIQHVLSVFNEDLLNFDFVCKLGLNIGPVTAGVIGTTKLYYDIWGDTVNIASRMYSTGVLNRIQVSQHTREYLLDRYEFEFRDHIEVKGIDGGMDTYLLVGRKGEGIPPAIKENNEDEF